MTELAPPRRSEGCLSDFALDQLIASDLAKTPVEASARRHLEACRRCAARLEDFRTVEAPPLAAKDAVPMRRRSQGRSFFFALPAVALLSAVGVVAALWIRSEGEGATIRTKGRVALGVFVKRASGAIERLAPGDGVAPGESLRFEVSTPRPGFTALFGLDMAGAVTAYAPVSGPARRLAGGPPVVLPESIVADETLGPERIVAIVCDAEPALEDLRESAVRALSRAGGDPLRASLDTDCAQASFDIVKRASP